MGNTLCIVYNMCSVCVCFLADAIIVRMTSNHMVEGSRRLEKVYGTDSESPLSYHLPPIDGQCFFFCKYRRVFLNFRIVFAIGEWEKSPILREFDSRLKSDKPQRHLLSSFGITKLHFFIYIPNSIQIFEQSTNRVHKILFSVSEIHMSHRGIILLSR